MLIVLLFWCLMIVPMSHGSSVDKIEETNSTLPVTKNMLHNELKKTNITVESEREVLKNKNITVASEGEIILSNTPIQSLPKEDQAFLITSAVDVSANKVKPRKGAFLDETKNITLEHSTLDSNLNLSSSQPLKSTVNTNTTNANTTKGKPLVLSAEAIAQADLLNNDPVSDDSEDRAVKIHKINSNGRPAMIMPVVITVLVVPMFAVIGYMALRRGQEAWKNRHYKRMDFLLDGMYND